MGQTGGDDETTLGELKAEILAFAEARDWLQFHTPKNLSMALGAEAGELMECFLWNADGADAYQQLSGAKQEAICDELADVVIYALEFANVTGIDLARAIRRKIAQNGEKYPVEKAKGRAVKYNEL